MPVKQVSRPLTAGDPFFNRKVVTNSEQVSYRDKDYEEKQKVQTMQKQKLNFPRSKSL